jgi:hypothetical protein
MSNKQSSVDWLVEQIKKDINLRLRGFDIDKALVQAKAMHKEEMERTYFDGWHRNIGNRDEDFDDYYNETFNTKEK